MRKTIALWFLLLGFSLSAVSQEVPRAITINEYGVVCDDKGRYVRLISIVPEP